MLKKLVLGVTVVAFAASMTVGTSFAAPKGQVEQGNGRSICMFSGLNDDPTEAFPDDGYVQSFGQLVKKLGVDTVREFGGGMVGIPGMMCNPNTGYDLHAGGGEH